MNDNHREGFVGNILQGFGFFTLSNEAASSGTTAQRYRLVTDRPNTFFSMNEPRLSVLDHCLDVIVYARKHSISVMVQMAFCKEVTCILQKEIPHALLNPESGFIDSAALITSLKETSALLASRLVLLSSL